MATDVLISSVSGLSGGSRITVGFDFHFIQDDVIVRGEGVTGPSERGVYKTDAELTIDFLLPPVSTPDAAPATLTIVDKMTNGSNRTHTFASMKPRGYDLSFNRDNPPATYKQKYVYVGDDASACYSVA
jgi:hypothetical protein